MAYQRVTFYIISLIISGILALATVYLYSDKFSHDRYWNGTIRSVSATEAKLIEGFFTNTAQKTLPVTAEYFDQVFRPIKGKIAIQVYSYEKLIFSNVVERFVLGDELSTFHLSPHNKVIINSYVPPTWGYIFERWLFNPQKWLTYSYNPITAPFLIFFFLYILLILTTGAFIKAHYLQVDVIRMLDSIKDKYK